MSPIALEMLKKAYKHYQDTGELSFSYQYRNGDDMFYSIQATEQLYEDEFIDNVSEFVFQQSFDPFAEPISFTLTDKGISYIRSQREV